MVQRQPMSSRESGPAKQRLNSSGSESPTTMIMEENGKRNRIPFFRRPKPTSPIASNDNKKSAVSTSRRIFAGRKRDSVEERQDVPLTQRTRVITTQTATSPPLARKQDDDDDDISLEPAPQTACCTSTAILQHSYMELLLCGGGTTTTDDGDDFVLSTARNNLPEDPTVQESIECVFASQLQEGLPLDDDEDDDEEKEEALMAPSRLQQSLLKSRSDSVFRNQSTTPNKTNNNKRKRKIQHKLVHVGTMNRVGDDDDNNYDQDCVPLIDSVPSAANQVQRFESKLGSACACCRQTRPLLEPEQWPQRPLFLRTTPTSGTVCKGIRFSSARDDYIWKGERSVLTWPAALQEIWEKTTSNNEQTQQQQDAAALDVMCPRCMVLPMNNGNEPAGQALVTDFETDLFEGTLLLRLRFAQGTTPQPYNDDEGYFAGMNRRYQAVVQGRFKKPIPLTECTTGFVLQRPCGKLPAKFVVKGALKVVSFFAPQLDARLDGDHPHSLSPLGSTPQTVIVHHGNNEIDDIEASHEEPTEDHKTLLQECSTAPLSMHRARFRKKAFDKLFAQKSPLPVADTNAIYTFEFLQHLFDFQEFTLAGGSMLGSIALAPVLNGQPLQIMAQYQDQPLWSFDLWHEDLYPAALQFDDEQQSRSPTSEF